MDDLSQVLPNLISEQHREKLKKVSRQLLNDYDAQSSICRGCGIGKLNTTTIYSFCGYVFVCDKVCFQLYLDSIPYGCPG